MLIDFKKNYIYYIVFAVLFIFLFRYGLEVHSLSVRAKSTETLLKQYRDREERSIKDFAEANRKLQDITIRVEQLNSDTATIRYENSELRKQLEKYSNTIRETEKQSIEIRTRIDNQSKSIDIGRTILQRIQERGNIKTQ